jgi:hypothetical protein
MEVFCRGVPISGMRCETGAGGNGARASRTGAVPDGTGSISFQLSQRLRAGLTNATPSGLKRSGCAGCEPTQLLGSNYRDDRIS